MILCECGEVIRDCEFRDYIKTSANPSTPTIGHRSCGLIFNFIDDKVHKKYSSRKELKILARIFAEKNHLEGAEVENFLLEVDRLKSGQHLSDCGILVAAFQKLKD